MALYWAREERAIAETQQKYGHYYHYIAYGLLTDDGEAEVVFDNSGYGEHGASSVTVTYYDKTAVPCRSDCLELYFRNVNQPPYRETSRDILQNGIVTYRQYRIPIEEYYPVEGQYRRISLKEAETLLEKGYVFGGHMYEL